MLYQDFTSMPKNTKIKQDKFLQSVLNRVDMMHPDTKISDVLDQLYTSVEAVLGPMKPPSAPARVEGKVDVFPLPCLPEMNYKEVPKRGRARQKMRLMYHATRFCNVQIKILNNLYLNHQHHVYNVTAAPSAAQSRVQETLLAKATYFCEEALQLDQPTSSFKLTSELERYLLTSASSSYTHNPSTTAKLVPGLVDLPDRGAQVSVINSEPNPTKGDQLVEDILLHPEKFISQDKQVDDQHMPTASLIDAENYTLLDDLHDKGLLSWLPIDRCYYHGDQGVVRSGIFGVAKPPKPNRPVVQRLIVNLVGLNSLLEDGGRMKEVMMGEARLPTPEAVFSWLVTNENAELRVHKKDMSNAFTAMRAEGWESYFAIDCPSALAAKLRTYPEGDSTGALFVPCCTSLPMGWSYSVVCCQLLIKRSCRELPQSQDVNRARVAQTPLHGCIIDDFFCLFDANSESGVKTADEWYTEVSHQWDRRKLPTNRQKDLVNAQREEIVGYQVSPCGKHIGVSVKKRVLLLASVLWSLGRHTQSNKVRGKILGKMVNAGLANRLVLSAFHPSCFDAYKEGTWPMRWSSEQRRSHLMFIGLIGFCEYDCSLKYCPYVYSSDACRKTGSKWSADRDPTIEGGAEIGLGAAYMYVGEKRSQQLAQFFAPSRSSCPHFSLEEIEAAGCTEFQEGGCQCKLCEEQGLRSIDFSEVFESDDVDHKEGWWASVLSTRYRSKEPICVAELKALRINAHARMYSLDRHDERVLHAIDNTSAMFAAFKGRSSNFKLNSELQKLAAITLGSNDRFLVAWISSARNWMSDWLSRKPFKSGNEFYTQKNARTERARGRGHDYLKACRVGEALRPGPASSESDSEDSFLSQDDRDLIEIGETAVDFGLEPGSVQRYDTAYDNFAKWLKSTKRSEIAKLATNFERLDAACAAYTLHLFEDGNSPAAAGYLISSISRRVQPKPPLTITRGFFTRMKARHRTKPALPLDERMAMSVVNYLHQDGRYAAAACVAASYCGLLRASEACALTTADVQKVESSTGVRYIFKIAASKTLKQKAAIAESVAVPTRFNHFGKYVYSYCYQRLNRDGRRIRPEYIFGGTVAKYRAAVRAES